jgi:hypothetical protein
LRISDGCSKCGGAEAHRHHSQQQKTVLHASWPLRTNPVDTSPQRLASVHVARQRDSTAKRTITITPSQEFWLILKALGCIYDHYASLT